MSWLIKSSIGRKLVMSISGLALILFLTFHMSMNLVALFSEEGYNAVCEFLGANWYALVATKGLALLFIVHIVYAFILTNQNRKARGNDRYDVIDRPKGVEWASQNMMVLGVIVLLGLGLHLAHGFWSSLHTIGFNNRVWFDRLHKISNIYATIIIFGFAAVVVCYFFRSLCGGACSL